MKLELVLVLVLINILLGRVESKAAVSATSLTLVVEASDADRM
jgi:hypothetical protein